MEAYRGSNTKEMVMEVLEVRARQVYDHVTSLHWELAEKQRASVGIVPIEEMLQFTEKVAMSLFPEGPPKAMKPPPLAIDDDDEDDIDKLLSMLDPGSPVSDTAKVSVAPVPPPPRPEFPEMSDNLKALFVRHLAGEELSLADVTGDPTLVFPEGKKDQAVFGRCQWTQGPTLVILSGSRTEKSFNSFYYQVCPLKVVREYTAKLMLNFQKTGFLRKDAEEYASNVHASTVNRWLFPDVPKNARIKWDPETLLTQAMEEAWSTLPDLDAQVVQRVGLWRRLLKLVDLWANEVGENGVREWLAEAGA